jgi:hypothetical protein
MARTKSKTRKSSGGRKTKRSGSGRGKAKRAGARSAASVSRSKAKSKRGGRGVTSAKKGRRSGSKSSRAVAARKGGRAAASKRRRKSTGQGRATRKPESKTGGDNIHGEGNYEASRNFRSEQTDFVKRNRRKIAKMGKEAEAALDGREGDELREAEAEASSHAAGQAEA